MKLTLLRKGVLLVSIPLCFEVSIFGVLINMQDSLEREAQRINHNKKINDVVNLVCRNMVLINNSLSLNDRSLSPLSRFHNLEIRDRIQDIHQNFLDLEELAKDDPVMLSKVQRCENALKLALEDIKSLRAALRNTTTMKEMSSVLAGARRDLEQHLFMLLRGGIFELSIETMKATDTAHTREIEGQKKVLLVCALFASVFLAIAGAYGLSKILVRRLNLVSLNAARLGKGEPLLPPLSGDDEVADLDRNLHTAAALIAAAQKMRREVTAMITHDLKSPLQSVRSYLEMLENGRLGTLNEKGNRLLGTAQNASLQMGGLIDNVLQLEKLRSGVIKLQTTSIQLPGLLEKSLDAVKLLAEQKQIVLERRYGGTGCDTISGDAFWLEQVFVNILSNAIKFSGNGTSVSVSMQSRAPGSVEVCITDQGPGIDPNEMKVIFDRFHRVQSTADTAGTGLGLPIAKELIELHHGMISVESEVGKGSSFIMKLPVSSADAQSAPAQESPAQAMVGTTGDAGAKTESEQAAIGNDHQANDHLDTDESTDRLETKKLPDDGDHARVFSFRAKGGKPKFRLLHKGLILISIPLIFEMFIFAKLMILQGQLEHETQRITNFKRFNDDANDIIRDMVILGFIGRRQKILEFNANPQVRILLTDLQRAMTDCKQVAETPRVMQDITEGESAVDSLFAEIDRRSRQMHEGTYKKMQGRDELVGQLYDELTRMVMKLGNRSISPKYELHSGELREKSRQVLNFALAFSILFAMCAAFMYRNNLVGRLDRVGENAKRLAKGEPLLAPVSGSDEIAELDATVHYAADQIGAAMKMRQEATAMITHDLKTPLQSVRSYFEMLGHGSFGELNERGTRLLQIGIRSVQHMAELINSVLQLEKLRTGNVTLETVKLQLTTLLDACLDSIKLLAGQKNIAILRGYDQSETSQIDGDAFWLEQVFSNILSNAIKFSPEDSTIYVGLKKQDHGVEVQVHDQGPGIPENEIAQIFERYHRVESTAAIPGTGLGLPIAKELIDLHHGSIAVESKPGSGCTFSVVLPFAQETGSASPM